MKGQVPAKIAARRQRQVEARQLPITEKSVDRFIGQNLDVLLEERLEGGEGEGEPLWLGRLYCHAPEVDGAAIVTGGGMEAQAGEVVPCTVVARRGGVDVEVFFT